MSTLPTDSPISCPGCASVMQQFCCEHKVIGALTLDVCFSCQGLWFDQFESQQIEPSGVLELFRQIHEHRDDARLPRNSKMSCPRCRVHLVQRFDISRYGRFSYHGCIEHHGRFTAFSALMVEKGFVRQLSAAEIEDLVQKVQIIRCSGCGAPIDIRTQTMCEHCHSPITILDPQAVEAAMNRLTQAATPAPNADLLALADVLLDNERAKFHDALDEARAGNRSALSTPQVDLVSSGVDRIWALLRH